MDEAARKAAADKADESIRQLPQDAVDATIASNTTVLLFYGATYCPYTQKYTPRWLDLQRKFDATPRWNTVATMFKVQCAQNEQFCVNHGVQGFPTIFVYHNGENIGEIDAEQLDAGVQKFVDQVQEVSGAAMAAVKKAIDQLDKSNQPEFMRQRRVVLKEHADLADLTIRQLNKSDVADTIKDGSTLLFFGANYCPYTQKYTPKWLDFQTLYDVTPEWNRRFRMYKIQCADQEEFCVNMGVDGYPTLFVFHNGQLISEIDVDWIKKGVQAELARLDALPVSLSSEANLAPSPSLASDLIVAELSSQSNETAVLAASNGGGEALTMSYVLFALSFMVVAVIYLLRKRHGRTAG
ncbi:Thioredoxin domain-containing protein 5 [Entophlyctis luteolus]|nr:Thioredoxin domain-containing protein 5 [Entophlyctis luteolus]